ncbi:hypothetical protein GF339_01770 [candidate division KSB3 bacterium]|uniref:Uncharacterized protein n=1 Tax=candidate division KSB3 bacterium TaxID=2044937 RepID=A0A9D5Q427_9BACT|nr:hypothetical protein [candidate division KSB3 bacterium]MBD3323279.1 hypothetical protein [candidate division KSB3 bacterium]
MLWQLHEIRHALAEEACSPEEINARAQETIRHYQLTNLILISTPEHIRRRSAA